MNHRRLISLTTCFIFSVVIGLSISSFADNDSETKTEAEQHFEKAYELRKATDYDAAIAEYEKVISLSPNSKIAQNAQYWIGQSYFESKHFDTALAAFQKLLDEYPASSIIPSTKQMIERVQQAKKNKSLFEAVRKADVEQVKQLIAEGADIDAKWGDTTTQEQREKAKAEDPNKTPLYFAVDANNMDLVKLFVEAGADVNAGRWPPLCHAVDLNNTSIAEYLIDHGANVNYPQDWGPLEEASSFMQINNMEMIKLLVARGAHINGESRPALHTALSRGKRKDIAEFLIQRGADVNAKDTYGYTPLYYAIYHIDDLDFVKLLIARGADVNAKQREGETLLLFAAKRGKTEVIKLLLEAGADINNNDIGQTALHAMLDIRSSLHYRLSKDILELLLAKGADVNLKDNNGRTPLLLSAESADGETVELLLDKGAEINARDDESGFTALHCAARFGNKEAAKILIARGADINAKDKQGHTPLYIAVNHDYQVADLLINKGADSSILTKSGKTLLQLAQERKEIESTVPDMIFDGKPDSLFGYPIACGDVDGDGHEDILIGAVDDYDSRGRVYLFYGGSDLGMTADLILEGQNKRDWFGSGIVCGDIDNDGYEDIIISAAGYNERRGCVYLFWGSDRNSMDAHPDKIFVGEERKGSLFGGNSPVVYDIDKDGYDDIILGASWNQGDGIGRAYLYYGNTKESMDTSYDLIFTAENPRDQYSFGLQIACGDIDNDGYGDIVIGSRSFLKHQSQAHLYYGDTKSNMNAKADVIFEVKSEYNRSAYYGRSIVCFDQNRDGYDDLLVGISGYNKKQGHAYLFYSNSKRNLDTDPDVILDGEVQDCSYGHNVVCGDIDGDNVNDIIIGARDFRQGFGRVYVYWGKELSDPDPKPGRIFTGENPNDLFGQGLACGDINNDGFDDLVVGAYSYKTGAKQGRAYLYYGGPRNK